MFFLYGYKIEQEHQTNQPNSDYIGKEKGRNDI